MSTTIEEVAEQVRGLTKLTENGFADIQRQLDRVDPLPVVVTKLEGEQAALRQDMDELKEDRGRGQEWRRGAFPIQILTAIMAITSIGLLATSLFH